MRLHQGSAATQGNIKQGNMGGPSPTKEGTRVETAKRNLLCLSGIAKGDQRPTCKINQHGRKQWAFPMDQSMKALVVQSSISHHSHISWGRDPNPSRRDPESKSTQPVRK